MLNVASSFNQEVGVVGAYTHELLADQIGVNLELDWIFSILDFVAPYLQDSSALFWVSWESEGLCCSLSRRHHDFTQRHLDLTDQVFRARRVVVPYLEVKLGVFVENVLHCEVLDPARVQIIIDNFSFTGCSINGVREICLFCLQGADGV